MQWQISAPIFRSTVIMKQLEIAVGISFGLVALTIGLASGNSVYTLCGLGLIAALLLFTWLFIMADELAKRYMPCERNDRAHI